MVLQRARNIVIPSRGRAGQIIGEAKELHDAHVDRDKMFSEWYSLLKMDDVLKQENMESFVGNDPRTTWNMAVYLLQPRPFIHQIATTDGTTLSIEAQAGAKIIEAYFRRLWIQIDRQDHRRGKQSWFWTMIGFMAATGWYAIPNLIRSDGTVFVDYWDPMTVYPEFGDDLSEGMLRLARFRTLTKHKAERVLFQKGVSVARGLPNNPQFVQLWKKEADGTVTLSSTMDNTVMQDAEVLEGFVDIPVEVGFTGGIPGTGTNLKHESMEGQSILATNEPLYRNINRQQTFMQQLLRDTANPRWFERLVGNKTIIGNGDKLYARGAVFSMGIQEEMGAIPMPPIPVELTQIMFNIRNQMQRGGFSDLTFGNVLQEVSAVLVSQAAEAALQLLTPFHNAVQLAITKITNHWYQSLLINPVLRPKDWPEMQVEDFRATELLSTYSIKIPGDLNNRINMAKALNPRFEITQETLTKMMLPEIANPVEELAKLDAEKAKQAPEYMTIQLIGAFDQSATEAFAAGRRDDAVMFTIVSDRLRKQLSGQSQTSDRVDQAAETRTVTQRRIGQ